MRLVGPRGALSWGLGLVILVVSYGWPLLLAWQADLELCGRGGCFGGSSGFAPSSTLVMVALSTLIFYWAWNPVIAWGNRIGERR